MEYLSIEHFTKAREALAGVILNTPLVFSRYFSELTEMKSGSSPRTFS